MKDKSSFDIAVHVDYLNVLLANEVLVKDQSSTLSVSDSVDPLNRLLTIRLPSTIELSIHWLTTRLSTMNVVLLTGDLDWTAELTIGPPSLENS